MTWRLDRTARTTLLALLAGCALFVAPALAEEAGPVATPETGCLLAVLEADESGSSVALLAESDGAADPLLAELLGLALLGDTTLDGPSFVLVCESAPDPGTVTDYDTAVWSRSGSSTATTTEP